MDLADILNASIYSGATTDFNDIGETEAKLRMRDSCVKQRVVRI